ncbi:hypothetical protein [Yoonia sp. SS1-5]|uniref:Uncharacterized protein n=1 Tax=Yoonia rhodophyticola TaxID=3137370 RepID=A0AAN0NKV1_9RHOB
MARIGKFLDKILAGKGAWSGVGVAVDTTQFVVGLQETKHFVSLSGGSVDTRLIVCYPQDTSAFMTTAQTITINNTTYDVSGAVEYHYGVKLQT